MIEPTLNLDAHAARYTTDVQLVQISANVGQTSLWQLPTKATTFARGGSWRACVRAGGAAELPDLVGHVLNPAIFS